MTHSLANLLSASLSLFAAATTPVGVSAPQRLKITDPPPQLVQTGGVTALRALIADYDRWAAENDPITAGNEGDQAALFRLPDASPAADDARRTALFEFQRRILALKSSKLRESDALNRELLTRSIADDLEMSAFDTARLPFTAYWSFSSLGEDLARETIIRNRQEADAYLSRLKALSGYYDQQISNARRGLATGFVQPKLVVEVALRTAKKQAGPDADTSPLLTPLDHLPTNIPAEAQAQLRVSAVEILKQQVVPAQRRIAEFLEKEYLPKARTGLAARDLPDGERYYRAAVRHYTTTSLSPDEVHEIGLNEVKRIHAEMEAVIAKAGFNGDVPAFIAFLRTDPQFYAHSREELLQRYQVVAKRIDPELPRLFGRLPRLTYGVKPIPTATEEGQTTGYYEGGSPERGVSGTLAVNLSHLDQRPLYEVPTLALHEGVPGHHLQIALSQELGDAPKFRRHLDYTAFVEGWGLYAEQLGDELGVYSTPYERFGQLSYEMWRACRLVADTGIHWLRWSREQARSCFLENTALSVHNIDTEVDRYISWPGQALAYKIGELKIMSLRRRAETELGDRFDERRFHDAVLLGGALPLDVLEARIVSWIKSEKTGEKNRN